MSPDLIEETEQYCKGLGRLCKLRDMKRMWDDAIAVLPWTFFSVLDELQVPEESHPNKNGLDVKDQIVNYDTIMGLVRYNFLDLLKEGVVFQGEGFMFAEDWFYPSSVEDMKCLISSRVAMYKDRPATDLKHSFDKMIKQIFGLVSNRTVMLIDAISKERARIDSLEK